MRQLQSGFLTGKGLQAYPRVDIFQVQGGISAVSLQDRQLTFDGTVREYGRLMAFQEKMLYALHSGAYCQALKMSAYHHQRIQESL